MSETREIKLGDETFAVPRLPLRTNMKVYPLCRKLHRAGIIERVVAAKGTMEDVTEEELVDLSDIAFLACRAADRDLTRDRFDELPIAPQQLFDAFYLIRYQTGVWLPPEEAHEGEGKGEPKPPTSTSAESSAA